MSDDLPEDWLPHGEDLQRFVAQTKSEQEASRTAEDDVRALRLAASVLRRYQFNADDKAALATVEYRAKMIESRFRGKSYAKYWNRERLADRAVDAMGVIAKKDPSEWSGAGPEEAVFRWIMLQLGHPRDHESSRKEFTASISRLTGRGNKSSQMWVKIFP